MFSEKWHYRFMEVARLIATWSKDPNTKTGAIVVGPDREIRATGYNGLVRGVNDDIPERMERPTKYDFFEHAERNAVYNACLTGTSLKGCVLYATHPPCTDCARAIIQAGIKTVVYDCDKYEHTPSVIASKRMLDAAGVRYYKYNRTGREIKLSV